MTEEKPKLLIVEDDLGLQKQLKWCFDEHEVLIAATRTEAIAQLRRFEPPVVLQDLGLPPDPEGVGEGMATLHEILSIAPLTKVIVVTGNHDRDNAIKAVSLGAYDFYQKPVDTDVLRLIVSRAFHIHSLEEQIRTLREAQLQSPFEGLIATDDAMRKVCRMVEKVAPTDVSVLILGESGTGKELLARAVHTTSTRKAGRFVAINCAAIPEQLLESELFGYEKGSFTGATKQTIGKIETADGGTLFLDEIGDMPLPLQVKLLRVVQEGEVRPVGSTQAIPVDVRVISATHRDLDAQKAAGLFREDLYYRLNVVALHLPPLAERREDIPLLAAHFLRKLAERYRKAVPTLSPDAMALLVAAPWPGNVRQLLNLLEQAVALTTTTVIPATTVQNALKEDAAALIPFEEARKSFERDYLVRLLKITGGNVTQAAQMAKRNRTEFYKLLQRHRLEPAMFKESKS